MPSCAKCGDTAGLTKVSAVVQRGRYITETRGQIQLPGYSGAAHIRIRSVHRSAVAVALAPPKGPPSVAIPAILFAVSGFFLMSVLLASVTSNQVADNGCVGFMLLIVSGTSLAVLLSRSRRQPVAVREAQVALSLWRACWYCSRCGAVCLFTQSGSRVLPARGLATALRKIALSHRADHV